MIALVLVFCHFGEPVECKVVRLTPEATTSIGCVGEAQQRAIEWLNGQPYGWDLMRWICEENVPQQKPT